MIDSLRILWSASLFQGLRGRRGPVSAMLLSVWMAPLALPQGASADDSATPRASGGIRTSTAQYTIPSVRLTRDDAKVVSLPEEMNDGRPVVLNFIFTSCSSVCPLMSEVFAQFARRLGTDRSKVHLMSISIDPEEDTPARLREYAQRFEAGPEWQHYTGSIEASLTVQRAFGVYRGDKMSHTAVTLLRAAPGGTWLRLDGFLTPDDLLGQYRRLVQEGDAAVAAR